MPKLPIDYSKTHFYKIVSSDTDNQNMYIGHTTNFNKRMWRHKGCCLNENSTHHNLSLYQTIRDQGGWDNWQMVLIETKNCENNLEARKYERELIEKMKPSMNLARPYVSEEDLRLTRKEYYINNIDIIKPKHKEYRDNHKEEKTIQDKEYRDKNSEKIKARQQQHYQEHKDKIKQRVKEYSENNKDKIKERGIKYREANKELLQQKHKEYQEKNSEIITCQCGHSFKKYNLWCHNKSQRHQKYLQSLL